MILILFQAKTFRHETNATKTSSKDWTLDSFLVLGKNPDNAADKAKFEASLKKFLDNSQYAKTKFIGKPPKAVRDVVDDSFTYSLILSFESAEDQAAYQEEAPHKVFIEECEDLWEKVIVYDSKGI